jgi:hypothetical protein
MKAGHAKRLVFLSVHFFLPLAINAKLATLDSQAVHRLDFGIGGVVNLSGGRGSGLELLQARRLDDETIPAQQPKGVLASGQTGSLFATALAAALTPCQRASRRRAAAIASGRRAIACEGGVSCRAVVVPCREWW